MQLHGARCTLRPWSEDDIAPLVRHADNRKVWLGLADRFPHPYTEEDARSWIACCGLEELPALSLAIEVDGEAIGGCGIEPWKGNFRRTGEIGYWLGEELWGRGIATEAVGLLTPHGFGELGFLRIQAHVWANNPASARVLEKNGFALEGTMRRAVVKDGAVLDVLLYAKLACDSSGGHASGCDLEVPRTAGETRL